MEHKTLAPAFRRPTIRFSPKWYVCCRAEKPPEVNGDLQKAVWRRVRWTDEFVDIEGPSKPLPELKTRVKMLWDDEYLYVGAELEEPDLWATITKRDAVIYRENDFEIFIDPDGDTHNYYEFEVNALGTVWDLMLLKPYRDGDQVAISAWDAMGLKVGVSLDGELNNPSTTDKGWSVELAIPWSALTESSPPAEHPSDGDQWRMNFLRVEWRRKVVSGQYVKERNPHTGEVLPQENSVWSPQGVIDMHYPEMWGFVQFSGASAGMGNEAFRWNPDEDAKWAMRKVYYAERAYLKDHDEYISDWAALGTGEKGPEGYTWPPLIRATPSLFEAVAISMDGTKGVHISNDGRVWISRNG